MIALLLKNYRAVALVLIIGLSLAYGFYYQSAYKSEKAAYSAFKLEIADLAAKQQAKNAFELQARQNITETVLTNHTLLKNKLRKHYAQNINSRFIPISLLNPSLDTCALPPSDESTNGVSETTDRAAEADTFNLELAGEEVLQCQALIEWVTEQDAVK